MSLPYNHAVSIENARDYWYITV